MVRARPERNCAVETTPLSSSKTQPVLPAQDGLNEANNADTEGHRVDVAADPTSHTPATTSNDDVGAGVGKHVGEEQTSQPSAEMC